MKTTLLATVACLAISFPAMAQNSPNGSQPSSLQQQQSPSTQSGTDSAKQAQQQSGSQMQSKQQQAQSIQPSSLSKQEVREIQMNLNKAGFDARNVDGIWGEETRQALRNFQQTKQLPGNGELNQQTLAALGVNPGNSSQANNQNGDQNNASGGEKGSQNASSGSNAQPGQSQTVGQSPAGGGKNQASPTSGQAPSSQSK